jgi:uroporphyrinogen decarboxylase
MDLSVEAEAFGAAVTMHDDEVPTITGRAVSNKVDIEKLAIPDPREARTKEYLKAAAMTAAAIADRPVFAGCIGPFSLAGRLYGMTEIMMDLLDEPSLIHALLEKATAFLVAYLHAFRATGANGIFIAEPAAGLLSPAMCDEFSSKYVRRLVDAGQTDEFAIILHNCGNTGALNASMQSTGAWGFHLGNSNPIAESLREFSPQSLVMGNMDPAGLMKLGKPDQVAAAARCLLDQTKGARNFVLSTGCDTPPNCPWENIQAFFAALDDYNKCGLGEGAALCR